MWRNVLGIETEVVVKNWEDYEAAIREGDYDVVRRGLVMQTTDELTNIRMLFREGAGSPQVSSPGKEATSSAESVKGKEKGLLAQQPIETEAQALRELSAMPIYFASSYSLVKPYVLGFDRNVLDTPSLKAVRINTDWKQAGPGKRSP